MYQIQQTKNEVMVWTTTYDGRRICVFVGKHRFEAALWIECAKLKTGWEK